MGAWEPPHRGADIHPVLCELIGEPIKQSTKLIGEPIRGRVKTDTSQSTASTHQAPPLNPGTPGAQSGADLDITVASRSAQSFEGAKRDRPALAATRFVACDIDDAASLAAAVKVRRAA